MTTVYDLHINFDDYDDATSLRLEDARKLVRGRGKDGRCSLEVLRRWAKPGRGCKPAGAEGPVLLLPVVRIGGALRTMPAWVEAFERARVRLGARVPAPQGPTCRQREAAYRRAEERLDAAGIGKKRE